MENENKETDGQKLEVTIEQPEAADNSEVLAELKALREQFDASQTATEPEVKGTYNVPTIIEEGNLGDSQGQAFHRWLKTGDKGAVKSMLGVNDDGQEVVEIKASNATDMNIGTAGDGGNTVTDDMYGDIIRRRDEVSLVGRLPITRFNGTGTTLDVPIDDEADSEFISTAEAGQFDEDAPAIGQLVLTKVKYTKRTLVSVELLQDTTVNVLNYVSGRVAIGYGKTLNGLIIDDVEANGTEFDVLAGTAAIAVDELEITALNDTNAFYVENPAEAAWVMKPATYRAIQVLDDANARRYGPNARGDFKGRELLDSPVFLSNKCEAIGSGLKPVLFGNWRYMALFEDPTLQFLRDPYTRADYGQIRLLWYFRADVGITQTAALGYARNITT